jgi:hypothetical protein
MFCPKCGTKNPEDGKFCRSCGVDLAPVNAAISGGLPATFGDMNMHPGTAHIRTEAKRRSDPHEVYGDSIRSIISGIGFLVVSIVLLVTGVAGGHAWWWAMLFPAFTFLAKGISDLMKSRKMIESRQGGSFTPASGHSIGSAPASPSLPSPQTEFIPPATPYRTGDLVPPSVTDSTTRHLEMNDEGETMTLPKK